MNINGHCPSCKISLDGDLLTNSMHVNEAKLFYGWDEYGVSNRWSKALAVYDYDSDRTVVYRCPECKHEWRLYE